jgi:hypothetical protein
VDRNNRRVLALLAKSREHDTAVAVPATALAQAVRDPRRQVRLMRLMRQPTSTVVPLDRDDSLAVGRLLAASGTADIADAHVVVCGRRYEHRIVTSDPNDLRALDPEIQLIPI